MREGGTTCHLLRNRDKESHSPASGSPPRGGAGGEVDHASPEQKIPPTLSLASSSLAELLAQAREALLTHGVRHETQRGATRSLNGVALTWTDPERDTTDGLEWTADEIAWYLRVFVEKRPENDPARLAKDGALVFPYTYAARSRYWDGGWGYLAALLEAIKSRG